MSCGHEEDQRCVGDKPTLVALQVKPLTSIRAKMHHQQNPTHKNNITSPTE